MSSYTATIINDIEKALQCKAVDSIKTSYIFELLWAAKRARKALYDLKDYKESENWAIRDNKDDLISVVIEEGLE